MGNSGNDPEFKNSKDTKQKQGNDHGLSRRDALKRVAKQALGLAGLFVSLPAISSISGGGPEWAEKPESNYYDYYNYYSYYCEDYYGYIYNQPGTPYQSYQGYWELIYSSYCYGYYSYSKTYSNPYYNYYSYSKKDSIPYADYSSYVNKDSTEYSSYWSIL
jgi:hypothetical protein